MNERMKLFLILSLLIPGIMTILVAGTYILHFTHGTTPNDPMVAIGFFLMGLPFAVILTYNDMKDEQNKIGYYKRI